MRLAMSPLAQIDVYTADRQQIDRIGVSSEDGDIVSFKADCLVEQGAGIDDTYPVRLACLHSHVVPLAA